MGPFLERRYSSRLKAVACTWRAVLVVGGERLSLAGVNAEPDCNCNARRAAAT